SFFQADDGIRVFHVTGVQTCALPISNSVSIPPTSLGCRNAICEPIEPCRGRSSSSRTPFPPILVIASEMSGTPNATWCTPSPLRSEEHTSELQSRENLVCRLLLEKKK